MLAAVPFGEVCESLFGVDSSFGAFPGLGGGSADASAVLVTLNKIHKLGLSEKELEVLSEELGSDCPFFVKNAPAFVSGRGEILEEVSNLLKGTYIKVIKPSVKIPTSVAFAGIVPRESESDFKSTYNGDRSQWQTEFYNDFEDALNDESLVCLQIKNELIQEGAFYASMSGSGSAVYGLFREEPASNQNEHFEWIGRLG